MAQLKHEAPFDFFYGCLLFVWRCKPAICSVSCSGKSSEHLWPGFLQRKWHLRVKIYCYAQRYISERREGPTWGRSFSLGVINLVYKRSLLDSDKITTQQLLSYARSPPAETCGVVCLSFSPGWYCCACCSRAGGCSAT